MERLKEKFQTALDLTTKIDPVGTPYQSKYEAREILDEILTELSEFNHSSALVGGIYVALGIIDLEVEELSKGEVSLLKSIELMCDVEQRDETILQEIKALNQLGILWCLREDYEQALNFLKRASECYQQFVSQEEKIHLYETLDLFTKEETRPAFDEKESALELLNTHTYYYLAQVYEKTGEASKSAECCYITLSKQLELKQFQHLDWATNASMLSQHYLANEKYKTAKRHLIASSIMLERYQLEMSLKEVSQEIEDERQEMYLRCKADVSRTWARYCLLLLQRSMDKDVERKQEENQLVDIADEAEETPDIHVDFPSIENDPILDDIPDNYATNFEEARAIFLPGQRFCKSAQDDYYKFEDHCVDYVDIQRDLSHMHKVLVYFEPDQSRKFKIHKRRIDLLEPVYKELNVKLFTLLVRQLMYEVAEVYSAMMDIKAETSQNNANKINSLVDSSMAAFKAYLGTLHTQEGKAPDKYPEDSLRPAMMAYFHLARLSDKYVTDNPQQKIKQKMQSFCYYKQIVDYCQLHPEAQVVLEHEFPICQELVILLPRKIQKMQQELRG